MRIAVFAPDIPYPAHRGGRADVWRRLLALQRIGHEVLLVNAQEPEGRLAPTAAQLAVVDATVAARVSFPIRRSPWRTVRQLALAWRTPWHAATRVPDPRGAAALRAALDRFRPELLWLEGPWFGRVVAELAAERGTRYVYRSHNVEHLYLPGQAAVAVRPRDRIAWRLACIGLRRYEYRLLRDAASVFDISMDDLAFWQRQGIGRIHWLPPLPQAALEPPPERIERGDLVFVGNLGTPNNVRGVEFLVREVMPRLLRRQPDARLTVVGSNPTPHARALLAAAEGVSLQTDVPDPMSWLLGARVLVNPVMTGSGVQLKSLDMLMTDLPVVTTRQGTRGLPADVVASMRVAAGADEFVAAIGRARLDGEPAERVAQRQASRARFSVPAVAAALEQARRDVQERAP